MIDGQNVQMDRQPDRQTYTQKTAKKIEQYESHKQDEPTTCSQRQIGRFKAITLFECKGRNAKLHAVDSRQHRRGRRKT